MSELNASLAARLAWACIRAGAEMRWIPAPFIARSPAYTRLVRRQGRLRRLDGGASRAGFQERPEGEDGVSRRVDAGAKQQSNLNAKSSHLPFCRMRSNQQAGLTRSLRARRGAKSFGSAYGCDRCCSTSSLCTSDCRTFQQETSECVDSRSCCQAAGCNLGLL